MEAIVRHGVGDIRLDQVALARVGPVEVPESVTDGPVGGVAAAVAATGTAA